MAKNYKGIQNYTNTLLEDWLNFNDGVLKGNMDNNASTLTSAAGTDTSGLRSRAVEFLKIGLLKQSISNGTNGIESIKRGENLQSKLGFISALIYKAYKNNNNQVIEKAFYALNALYAIILSIEVNNHLFSVNYIIRRLLECYPCEKDTDRNEWSKYLIAAFLCEAYDGSRSGDLTKFLLGKIDNISLRFIYNKGSKVKGEFSDNKSLKEYIKIDKSLNDIFAQRVNKYLYKSENNIPYGCLAIAEKYFDEFLESCYLLEKRDVLNSPFLSIYGDGGDENDNKGNVIETLKDISKSNRNFELNYKIVMKSIEEGAIEALSFMTDKPMSDFIIPDRNGAFNEDENTIISALRTKPFLLLAGISGTGKSRKVQELAYLTCKRDGMHDADETNPGNYLLIPVKPNWHDSTELLGYYSSITGKYILTDFIRFVWKASINKDVPYFLCLDEMNLAPVEQYFAEYLSVLETRKLVYNEDKKTHEIQSAEILSKKIFEGLSLYGKKKIDNPDDDGRREEEVPLYKGEDVQIINYLQQNGLRLPDNLFVIGTVNMDDTTHQFSRKVIDRAFTIEMNGDDLSKMFDAEDTLTYQNSPMTIDEIKPLFVKAQEVLEVFPSDAATIKDYAPKLLDRINGNGIFKDTPFRVSYRVQNELVLYYAAIRPKGVLNEEQIKPYLQEAFMAILLEKVLPRVEGDEKAMRCNEKGDSAILLNLMAYLNEFKPSEGEPSKVFTVLMTKLNEMNERVKNSYFTSFFS